MIRPLDPRLNCKDLTGRHKVLPSNIGSKVKRTKQADLIRHVVESMMAVRRWVEATLR